MMTVAPRQVVPLPPSSVPWTLQVPQEAPGRRGDPLHVLCRWGERPNVRYDRCRRVDQAIVYRLRQDVAMKLPSPEHDRQTRYCRLRYSRRRGGCNGCKRRGLKPLKPEISTGGCSAVSFFLYFPPRSPLAQATKPLMRWYEPIEDAWYPARILTTTKVGMPLLRSGCFSTLRPGHSRWVTREILYLASRMNVGAARWGFIVQKEARRRAVQMGTTKIVWPLNPRFGIAAVRLLEMISFD